MFVHKKTLGKKTAISKFPKWKDLKILRFFNPKFVFLEIFSKSGKIFIKTGIYVIEVHTNNKHAKFQSNIFVFACAMAKKDKSDDVTFLKRICVAFLIVVHKKINDVFGILRHIGTR